MSNEPLLPPSDPQQNMPYRYAFMLIVWAEGKAEAATWRGCLEAPNGRRTYFQTMSELEQILCAWQIYLDR